MKIVKIQDSIYQTDIRIIINCTQEELGKYIKKEFDCDDFIPLPQFQGRYFNLFEDNGFVDDIVWVGGFDWTIKQQETLNHELLHCAVSVLDRRNIKTEHDNSEPLAYYHGYLFREAWEAFKPKKAKKKRR